VPQQIQTYPEGRRCTICNMRLSIYNKQDICYSHQEGKTITISDQSSHPVSRSTGPGSPTIRSSIQFDGWF